MTLDTQHHGHEDQQPAHAAKGAHIDATGPGKKTQVETAAHGAEPAEAASADGGINIKVLQDFIAKHEGNVDHVYKDSRGFLTAGIGHLLTGSNLHLGQHVSAQQVTAWFKSDVAKAIAGAKKDMGAAFDKLNEARKIVVIDMVFNLGTAGFGQFHQTIHAMQTGNFSQAATNMLNSLWASQVGNRAKEDAAIMRSGHMSGVGGGGGGGGKDDKEDGHGGGDSSGKAAPAISQVREGHGAIKEGEHGASVKTVQHLLHVTPADGIFGPHTLAAVVKFQRSHKLDDDGIVGEKTLHALEHQAKPKTDKKKQDDDDGGTGGVKAPDGKGHDPNDHKDSKDGKWTKAPSLEAVKSGNAELHKGERGPAVKSVQRLLAVTDDGEFGPATKAAVVAFQNDHHMKKHDGEIDAHTLDILTKHPVGSVEGESRDGARDRARMLSISRSQSAGRRPDGRCYYHVCQFLVQCNGYGKITNPYKQFPASALPEAHNFADFVNSTGPQRWGLEKLSIHNPYDAPPGAIVVVAAGSPGTAHPTAGDIAIADGNGAFYNGGLMGYSGKSGWANSKSARLLGAYIPV